MIICDRCKRENAHNLRLTRDDMIEPMFQQDLCTKCYEELFNFILNFCTQSIDVKA